MSTEIIISPIISSIPNLAVPVINIAPWHTTIFIQGVIFISLGTIVSIGINYLRKKEGRYLDYFEGMLKNLIRDKFPELEQFTEKTKPLISLFSILGVSAVFANAASCSLRYYFNDYIIKFSNAMFQNAIANKVFTIFMQSMAQMIFPLMLSVFLLERYLTCSIVIEERLQRKANQNLQIDEERLDNMNRILKERAKESFWHPTESIIHYAWICGGIFMGILSKSLLLDFLKDSTLPKVLASGIAFGVSSILCTAITMLPEIIETFNKEEQNDRASVLVRCGSGIIINAILTSLIHGVLFNGLLGGYFNKSGYFPSLIEGVVTMIISTVSMVGSAFVKDRIISLKNDQVDNPDELGVEIIEGVINDIINYTIPLYIL